jgi:hypothetical protein
MSHIFSKKWQNSARKFHTQTFLCKTLIMHKSIFRSQASKLFLKHYKPDTIIRKSNRKISGFVKRNETENTEKFLKRNETERKENDKVMKRNEITVKRKRNGTKFLWNDKNETKRNYNNVSYAFQISKAFYFQHLFYKSKVLFPDDVSSTVFTFFLFYSKILSYSEKNLENCKTSKNSVGTSRILQHDNIFL